jgi:hypothetical protein
MVVLSVLAFNLANLASLGKRRMACFEVPLQSLLEEHLILYADCASRTQPAERNQ